MTGGLTGFRLVLANDLRRQDLLLQAARDIVRAHKQGIDLERYFNSLTYAIEEFRESAFDDWCFEVNRICRYSLKESGYDCDECDFDWDYNQYFNRGLTSVQGAKILRQHLIDTGMPLTIREITN